MATIVSKAGRRAGCRPGARAKAGTAATSGQARGQWTTCSLSAVSDARVEAARLWRQGPDGAPMSKREFISRAIDAAVRLTMADNPGFSLPPGCAFEITSPN